MAIVPPIKDYTLDGMQPADAQQPRTRGFFISADSAYTGVVRVGNGKTQAYVAGRMPDDGSEVSVIYASGYWWAISATAGYPSNYPRELSDFSETNPAGVFLRYVMRDNPVYLRYQTAQYVDAAGENHIVKTPEGQMISCVAEFAGQPVTWPVINDDNLVLIYRESPDHDWKLIAEERAYWLTTGDPPPLFLPGQVGELYHNFPSNVYDPDATFEYELTGAGVPYLSVGLPSPVRYGDLAWTGTPLLYSAPFAVTQTTQAPTGTTAQLRLTATSIGVLNEAYENVINYLLSDTM